MEAEKKISSGQTTIRHQVRWSVLWRKARRSDHSTRIAPRMYSPSPAFKMRATKSVPPMTSESPLGAQAISYTSEEEARDIVRRRQCSFANSASPSSSKAAPKEFEGPSEGIHRSTMPSSPVVASNSPFGQKRTQLTTPECLRRVALYSTRGGCLATGWPDFAAAASAAGDGMLG